MPIGNPRWLPPQVIVLTQDHIGKIQKYLLLVSEEKIKPEALKSLYRSPGNKKNQLVLCKNYVLRHLGITINKKNTKFVKDLPMIDAQFRFNQCNSFREEYIGRSCFLCRSEIQDGCHHRS
jgi:hypothetical protein